MSTKTVLVRRPKPVSTALFRHPRGRLAALLTAPMIWLVGVYLLSLALMLITAFWTTDPFTSRVRPGFTLDNFVSLVTVPAYLATSLRTLGIAIAVTVICAAFAIPLAVFMAKVAKPGYRSLLAIGVTLPLWAGYLVKIIGMRLVWTENGFFNWALSPLGITGPAFGTITVILTLVYLWFPYMAIPVYSAVSQIPANLFDASADLGANGFGTIRTVIAPLLIPAVFSGSVFTFSLSFGDYISAMYVGGSTQMIGSIIASNINLNPPLAAAFSVVPIVMVLLYLAAVRRSGALNNL
ncbi:MULTISPECIES: ABC transporter permease [unclassified Mycolicibacterium]|uniref:ABC transporter permease n=1 Tax=unclassified Mycolicibacterium TaxID=2636767 RepID=UPI001308377A|nr:MULTISPECIES: ABC transporter permease [unclassified Mycolicibacterium]MUL81224.1 ABC transporter permease [Mycolicibacterium sp. CBMA 329]MUL86990.1 ABC transporter permease [Mycolicibacterium sp. CBMA 331]MUL98727.1 ABC transporter permease [Mycolicibacterium sp. CBMA 334]MUM37287.1 ABC transporter permease [Mycolicibacterium sp. CBMA 247]MUM43055.1 ABC transporter permease [Mycolicibacterium sp. CBMA 294]